MQVRHKDRKRYFEEQAATSKEYYLEYVERFHKVEEGLRVLEIGCGKRQPFAFCRARMPRRRNRFIADTDRTSRDFL